MGETLDTMTGSAKTCSFPIPEPACFAPAQGKSQLEFNLRRTSFFKELFDILRLPGHEEGKNAAVSEEP